jgi:hypothetical protein
MDTSMTDAEAGSSDDFSVQAGRTIDHGAFLIPCMCGCVRKARCREGGVLYETQFCCRIRDEVI